MNKNEIISLIRREGGGERQEEEEEEEEPVELFMYCSDVAFVVDWV